MGESINDDQIQCLLGYALFMNLLYMNLKKTAVFIYTAKKL